MDDDGPKSDGRFKAGNKASTGGRRRLPDDLRQMLEAAMPHATRRVIEALDAERTIVIGAGESASPLQVPDWDTRLKAYTAMHDRLYGKPAVEMDALSRKKLRAEIKRLEAGETLPGEQTINVIMPKVEP